MQSFIHHARDFHSRISNRADEKERFGKLAHGQSPDALFITCSDSRVMPSLFTGAQPGQLFELRTAGNAVPPYGAAHSPSGEAATIEYAVSVLQVPDIVVCGHSHCGAVGARVRREDLAAVPAVDGWLTAQLAEPSELAGEKGEADEKSAEVVGAVQRHVLGQLERLKDYPCVQERLDSGRLRLHAWFYAVDTGLVLEHRPAYDAFLPL